MSAKGFYEDLRDNAFLRKFMEGRLEEYNRAPGFVMMDLVLFRDCIEHVTRIMRVISQPRGNMLLIGIGGSGRQSVAKLAIFICEYSVFQIEMTKNYRIGEFRENLKKLYGQTGVSNRPTAFLFLDNQCAQESFLEDINNILSSGEVPNLFKPEEFEEVKNRLSAAARREGIPDNTEALFAFFVERVRPNLHIILCMSPIGDDFRDRLRQYPALVNCSTIDWFTEWPREALLEVAERSLQDIKLAEETQHTKAMQDKRRTAVAQAFATIHYSVGQSSRRMLLEMKRHNYVTATNYLELVAGYKNLLAEKRKELGDAADKLRSGLSKIDDTRYKVKEMSLELEDAKKKVALFQQECDDYLVIIVQQKREADEQQKSVSAKSIKIAVEEEACKKMAAIALVDLEEAMPALNEAIKAEWAGLEHKCSHPTWILNSDILVPTPLVQGNGR